MTQLTLTPSEDLQALRADVADLKAMLTALVEEHRPEWLTPDQAAKEAAWGRCERWVAMLSPERRV